MLPLRDDNPTRRFAWVTFVIVVLNFATFLLWEPIFASGPDASDRTETFLFCHAEVPWETSHFTDLADGGAAARRAIARSGILTDPGRAAEFQRFLSEHCGHKSWFL